MKKLAKKLSISVVILNYNAKEFLRDCLVAVEVAGAGLDFEAIVVDNVSSDGSVEYIRKEFPWVRLIINKENIGFAAGNNIGVSRAKGRFVLFLNPDTVLQGNTLKAMLDLMKSDMKIGAATCRIELPNGVFDYPCHRGFPTPWNAFCYFSGLARLFPQFKLLNGYTLNYLPKDTVHEIDSASGSFLFVRREAGEAVGWWDEDYFWYGEDLDFCYRLKKSGWKIMFNPGTKIVHYRGVTSGILKHSQNISTATRETKIRSVLASTGAMRTFFNKHYRRKYPASVLWLVIGTIAVLEQLRVAKIKLNL